MLLCTASCSQSITASPRWSSTWSSWSEACSTWPESNATMLFSKQMKQVQATDPWILFYPWWVSLLRVQDPPTVLARLLRAPTVSKCALPAWGSPWTDSHRRPVLPGRSCRLWSHLCCSAWVADNEFVSMFRERPAIVANWGRHPQSTRLTWAELFAAQDH